MSEDFFDEVDWFRKKFGGELQSDDEIVDRFAIHGAENRIALLGRIEGDKGEVTNLRKTARTLGLTRKMNDIHQTLLKAGR